MVFFDVFSQAKAKLRSQFIAQKVFRLQTGDRHFGRVQSPMHINRLDIFIRDKVAKTEMSSLICL